MQAGSDVLVSSGTCFPCSKREETLPQTSEALGNTPTPPSLTISKSKTNPNLTKCKQRHQLPLSGHRACLGFSVLFLPGGMAVEEEGGGRRRERGGGVVAKIKDREVVMGDMCRHHSVVQSRSHVFPMFLQSMFSFVVEEEEYLSRHLSCKCCTSEDRRSGACDAFLCAGAASTWSHDAFVKKHSKQTQADVVVREPGDMQSVRSKANVGKTWR